MTTEAERRRAEAVARINAIDRGRLAAEPDRRAFFDTVYESAAGDPAGVPWADLKPKAQLVEWLSAHPGKGCAIDVACGLGDNAEAMAAAGFAVTAFDGSAEAIGWARERFPDSPVDYRVADLLDPPAEWRGRFELVNECYTIQSVPPERHLDFARAIAKLVAPGGTLLIYTRTRPDGGPAGGPPWPLAPSVIGMFGDFGFELVAKQQFELRRPDRVIPHLFCEWRRQVAGDERHQGRSA